MLQDSAVSGFGFAVNDSVRVEHGGDYYTATVERVAPTGVWVRHEDGTSERIRDTEVGTRCALRGGRGAEEAGRSSVPDNKRNDLSESPKATAVPAIGGGGEVLLCLCRKPYDSQHFMVGCDSCKGWFHPRCVNMSDAEAELRKQCICPNCEPGSSEDSSESSGDKDGQASSNLARTSLFFFLSSCYVRCIIDGRHVYTIRYLCNMCMRDA